MHRTILTLAAGVIASCGGPRATPDPKPSQGSATGAPAVCGSIKPGTTLADHRAALARLRAAPPTCRRDGIEALAMAALVDAGQLARLVDGTATIESVFAEARALHAKGEPSARPIYDAAVALAALAGTEVVTWIPEAANRPPFREVIVSPDGKRWLAVQSRRVAVYDVETGLAVATIPMHTGGVHFALLDGGRIAAADFRSVRVLDATGKLEKNLREAAGEYGRIEHAVVAGAAGLAIVDDKSIEIVSVAPATLGKRIARADRKPGGLSPWLRRTEWRGKTLVVFDGRRTELWQVDGTTMTETAALAYPLEVVATSWDGTRIATLPHLSRPLRVIDPKNTELASVASPTFGYGYAFAGNVLSSGDFGKLVRLDGNKLVETKTLVPKGTGWTTAGERIVMGSNGVIAPDGTISAQIAPGPAIDALAWSPRGELVVAGDGEITILGPAGVRSTKGGNTLAVRAGDTVGFRGMSEMWWLEGTKDVARTDHDVFAWDIAAANGRPELASAVPPAKLGAGTVIALTADGTRYVVQPGFDEELELHDAATRAQIQKIHVRDPLGHGKAMDVDRAAFVDGDRLLVLSGSGYTTVWNMTLKVAVWNQQETFVAVSRDGQSLVTEATDGIHGWDLGRNRDLGKLKLAAGTGCDDRCEFGAAAFSPDGGIVAVGTRAGTVDFVDIKAWKVVRSLPAHELEVAAVAWRPDGKLLATASRGGVVKLWTPAGELVATIAVGTNARDAYVSRKEVEEPDAWLVVLADGSARGNAAGRAHLATRAGPTPIGTGLAAPLEAQRTAWNALFTLVP